MFDAWTSEEVMRRWFHGHHDWETPEAELDLRIGGAVRVVMRDPKEGTELIELDIEEAEGVTTVRFKHSNLRDEESVRSHEEGWSACFDNLEQALAMA